MPKKFSLDLPRLITAKKVDRSYKDHQTVLVDSPPPTPKSIRPPLPAEIEVALRNACTKIAQESNTVSLPGADHDLLIRFWRDTAAADDDAEAEHRQEVHDARPQVKHALTDPANAHRQDADKRQSMLRAETVMADTIEPPQQHQHQRSKSATHNHLTATLPKSVQRRRKAPRQDSVDTSYSATYSEATDDHADASTALTSVVITPAKGSQRTSGHGLAAISGANNTATGPTAVDRSTRQKSDELRRPQDSSGRARLRPRATSSITNQTQQRSADAVELTLPIDTLFNISRAALQPEILDDQRNQHDPSANRAEPDTGVKSKSAHLVEHRVLPRHRAATMESSMSEDVERSGRTTFRSRATTSARSLSRGMKEYCRPSSRRAEADTKGRSECWVQTATSRIRHLTWGGRKIASMDLVKGGRRRSKESYTFGHRSSADQSGVRSAQDSGATNPWSGHRGLHSVVVNHGQAGQGIETVGATKAIDLNRELPPLPTISQWQDETEESPTHVSDRAETELSKPVRVAVSRKPVAAKEATASLDTAPPLSPIPLMSATAFPGDYEYFEPLYMPSPISESSVKVSGLKAGLSKRSIQSVAFSNFLDDDDLTLESPKVARLLNRLSAPDLRPQLVHNRRPSSQQRPRLSSDDQRHCIPMDVNVPVLPSLAPEVQKDDSPSTVSTDEYETTHERMSVDSSTAKAVIAADRKTKRQWWKASKLEKHDWTMSVKQKQSNSSDLSNDKCATAPVIRYS